MSNKLQELTDRLYNEGLSKGKEQAELMVSNAKAESEKILSDAKKEAAAILEAAAKQAEELKSKTESDVKMASEQCFQALKKDIEDILVNAVSANKVSTTIADADYIKGIITTVAQKFSTSESSDLSLILPAAMQEKLEPWLAGELKAALGKDIKADFSRKISGGFCIGPKDGSWYVSMTDETFRELIAEYLRPVTRKLLF